MHAAFTTALARLELYKYIKLLDEWVLYYDTDSVIYIGKKGVTPEVSLGNYLGEMTDELKGHVISNWVCGGPKNYAYLSYDPNDTSKEKREFKCKGIKDSVHASERINFDVLRNAVLSTNSLEGRLSVINMTGPDGKKIKVTNNLRRDPLARIQQFKIARNLGRDPNAQFLTERVFDMQRQIPEKLVSLTFDKRCVAEDKRTYPFGYRFPQI